MGSPQFSLSSDSEKEKMDRLSTKNFAPAEVRPQLQPSPNKSAAHRKDLVNHRTARTITAGRTHPVYLMLAPAPAYALARICQLRLEGSGIRSNARTASTAKKPIQISGEPAVLICQNTIGVIRNVRTVARAHSNGINRRASWNSAAAVRHPAKKISRSASVSPSRTKPSPINSCPSPKKNE